MIKTRCAKKQKELLARVGVSLDPRVLMKDLSVSERQMVEIAKCVSYNAKIVIMDEPTSAITDKEVERLFAVLNDLKAKGVAIIYISHKMDEVLKISDEVTILRDGTFIDTFSTENINIDQIIVAMVGREYVPGISRETQQDRRTGIQGEGAQTGRRISRYFILAEEKAKYWASRD